MELTGTESGRLTDDAGRPMPYEVTVSVAVSSAGPVRITRVELSPIGEDTGITPQAISALASAVEDFADYAAARAIALWHAEHQTPLHLRLDGARALEFHAGRKRVVDSQPVSVIVGPRHVAELQGELARRRGRANDLATYERVAETYRKAQAQGIAVREAVGAAFFVGPSQADKLIREARRRGLLPPARRGRSQAPARPVAPATTEPEHPQGKGTGEQQ